MEKNDKILNLKKDLISLSIYFTSLGLVGSFGYSVGYNHAKDKIQDNEIHSVMDAAGSRVYIGDAYLLTIMPDYPNNACDWEEPKSFFIFKTVETDMEIYYKFLTNNETFRVCKSKNGDINRGYVYDDNVFYANGEQAFVYQPYKIIDFEKVDIPREVDSKTILDLENNLNNDSAENRILLKH